MMRRTREIIIPVHNAPELTSRCLKSVAHNRDPERDRITLVDDGSWLETSRLLQAFSESVPHCVLIRSERATGFTKAANRGLQKSSADLVVVLNSDTEVAPRWLDRIERVMFETPGVGIVGPLSNAASYQSIPRQQPNETERLSGQTVINDMPHGMALESLNSWLEEHMKIGPVRVPLIHGFCFAVRKEVMSGIGFFDEKAFPEGFGEEDDYCIRAVDAGWSLVIATDTYVWHEKSGSYSNDRRRQLVSAGRERFIERHGAQRRANALKALAATGSMLCEAVEGQLRRHQPEDTRG